MPSRRWPVIIKASRTEIVEFMIEVAADSPRDAESIGLSEGRKKLRQGELPEDWTRKSTPWHVIDSIPVRKADGSPHPG